MTDSVSLAIVIPTLGEHKKLLKLLESVSLQNYVDQCVVYVVDNSLNKNLESEFQAVQVQSKFKVYFLKCEKQGVNWARNLGLKKSTAQVVLFLDDDCWLRDPNLLLKHVSFHCENKNAFAIGGYYHLPHGKSLFDRCYHEIQMNWLEDGVSSESGLSRYLIGGHFSIKSELAKSHGLEFNDAIAYGGSELSFFQKACDLNLSLILKDVHVVHDTNENLVSLTRKLFKQGRGKALAGEQRHNHGAAEIVTDNPDDKGITHGLLRSYLKLIFWVGYYQHEKNYKGSLTHLSANVKRYLNQKKISYTSQLDKKIKAKDDRGDWL